MARTYAPGTNLKREPAHAGWLYLLPDLRPAHAVLIGVPGIGTLRMTAARAGAVTVIPVGRDERRRVATLRADSDLAGVSWIDGDVDAALRSLAETADVVTTVHARASGWLNASADRMGVVRRVIERGGTAVLAGRFGEDTPVAVQCGAGTIANARPYRVLPLWGEPRVWVADGDEDSLKHVLAAGLVHPWSSAENPRMVDRVLRRVPARWASGRRFATILRVHSVNRSAVPDYLSATARSAGLDLDGYRGWFSVPEGYRSRKAVFRLFGPTPAHPSYIIKLVSHPEMNPRLDNEAQALIRLEGIGFTAGGRAPRIAFVDQPGGLTLVCESAVAGDPFARRAVGPVPCALGREAVEILTDLSRRTRSLPEDASTRTSHELNAYLESFGRIYADRDLTDWLGAQMGVLESSGARLPRVFQHGDPGTWNALATGDGRVSFLDWESADALGMPLWDLFYFLRSYGVTRLRQQGVRSSRVAFERTFFGSSELSAWVRRVIADYVAAIGLERPWVAPLFCTCWMHRSLKEATRLEVQALGTGHFLNVLRRCRRESDLEARLLGVPPAS